MQLRRIRHQIGIRAPIRLAPLRVQREIIRHGGVEIIRSGQFGIAIPSRKFKAVARRGRGFRQFFAVRHARGGNIRTTVRFKRHGMLRHHVVIAAVGDNGRIIFIGHVTVKRVVAAAVFPIRTVIRRGLRIVVPFILPHAVGRLIRNTVDAGIKLRAGTVDGNCRDPRIVIVLIRCLQIIQDIIARIHAGEIARGFERLRPTEAKRRRLGGRERFVARAAVSARIFDVIVNRVLEIHIVLLEDIDAPLRVFDRFRIRLAERIEIHADAHARRARVFIELNKRFIQHVLTRRRTFVADT